MEGIASANVILRLLHRIDEAFAGEPADKVGLVQGRRTQRFRIRRTTVAQPMTECVQAPVGLRPGLRRARVGVHDQIQAAFQIVEHRQLIAAHQQDVGRAQFVGLGVGLQARLDVLDAFEAKPSHQSAIEARQATQLWHFVRSAQTFDFGQRVGHLTGFHHVAMLAHRQRVPTKLIHRARRQANDGIAAKTLAALHRFKQIGMRAIGQF